MLSNKVVVSREKFAFRFEHEQFTRRGLYFVRVRICLKRNSET